MRWLVVDLAMFGRGNCCGTCGGYRSIGGLRGVEFVSFCWGMWEKGSVKATRYLSQSLVIESWNWGEKRCGHL